MTSGLQEKIKEQGFESLDEFVEANLHYLPEDRQKCFDLISEKMETGYSPAYTGQPRNKFRETYEPQLRKNQ